MDYTRRVLAEGANFLIHHQYETAYLTFKNRNAPDIIIGDFYGDPQTAFISDDESYCAIGGCGLIIYYLTKPFEPFQYNKKSRNWTELFRQQEDLLWIENIYSKDDEQEIRLVVDLTNDLKKGIYKLDLKTFTLEKLL